MHALDIFVRESQIFIIYPNNKKFERKITLQTNTDHLFKYISNQMKNISLKSHFSVTSTGLATHLF